MKKRFTEEQIIQIIQILKEREAGERTADVLQVEGEVWGYGSLRCSEAAVSGSREHTVEEVTG